MPSNLSQALDQISEIRRTMVRSQVFRGYRAQTTAITGVLALIVAAIQSRIVPDPWHDMPAYFALWCGLAVICVAIFGIEQYTRCRRLASPLQNERTFEALERFIPSLVAGAIVTIVFYCYLGDLSWMLPGFWAIFFSLGIFASRSLLPRGISGVAGYYLIGGCLCLIYGHGGSHYFSPWEMALTFGVGQLLAAGVLYWNLERRHHGRQSPAR
jgi:hypothetical protein